MAGFRRAFLLASAERYLVLIINLGVTVVISRLLTPSEFGLSVIGAAALGIAEVVREFGVSAYLIQQRELTAAKIRSAFTVTLVLTVVAVAPLFLLAKPIAQFYGLPDLEFYLRLTCLSFCVGPFTAPVQALLRRNMQFGTMAAIGVLTALSHAITSVTLASIGFSYMSFAWAGLVSAAVLLLLCVLSRPDLSIFRPSLKEWRCVVGFGAYDSGIAVLTRLWEYFPYLILGRILNAEAVGLYQRGWTVCKLADRVLLAGVHSVALPAFSAEARDGRSLKTAYLGGIEFTTVVLWPALLLLALLAHPVVSILLGSQWVQVAPLLQIMAIAQLSAFTTGLNYPTLVAVGAIRQMLLLTIVQVGSSIAIISTAAFYGLYIVVLSLLFTLPFNIFLAICLVRRHVDFQWGELLAAMRKSTMVAAASAIGPLLVVLAVGSMAAVSKPQAALAVLLSGAGWLAALWLTAHPLLREMLHVRDALLKSAAMTQVLRTGRRILRQP